MGKSVLIVDDSASMRQMLKFTLQKAGFAVAEGSDGREGLKQLASARPDLIITDLNMPNMDGLDFIRGVRAQPGSQPDEEAVDVNHGRLLLRGVVVPRGTGVPVPIGLDQ